MAKFDYPIDFVLVESRNAASCQVARKEEDRIAQAKLDGADTLPLDRLIRGDAAASVNRSAGIGLAGRPDRLGTVRIGTAERAAAIDIVVVVPASVVTLNQPS